MPDVTCRSLCAVSLTLLAFMVRADDTLAVRGAALADDFVSRLKAEALLQTLKGDLLSHDSATATLERWCALHRLASPPRIAAERISGADKPLSPEQRRELDVGPSEAVRYRRVKLRCGATVLSEADNWYVPGRLTAEMNRLLDTGDTPFGKVVQALNFRRRTLSSDFLWLPLPDGWEMSPPRAFAEAAPLAVPDWVLENRALLTLADGTPFSLVVETYSGNILALPP